MKANGNKEDKTMNSREKAISELMDYDTANPNNQEMLFQSLRRLSDTNLFALYVEVFGKPVEVRA